MLLFYIPLWGLRLRLKGENQPLLDFTRNLDEFSCWLENIENAQEEKPTISREENLKELMAS